MWELRPGLRAYANFVAGARLKCNRPVKRRLRRWVNGTRDRCAGILQNELYAGRLVCNKSEW